MTLTSSSGLCNIRDLGGLPTDDGRITRTGVLYRSDAPLPDDPPPAALPFWPPRTVLDLRSTTERALVRHPLAAADTVVHPIPVIDDAALAGAVGRVVPSGPETDPWFVDLYRSWLGAPAGIVAAVDAVVGGESPVLVHCAAGRDRTGVVTALLLRAAGVRRDAIIEDYRLTEPNQARIAERLALAGHYTGTREALAALRTPKAIEHVVDVVDHHPGGATGWLQASGAQHDNLQTWTDRFTETR